MDNIGFIIFGAHGKVGNSLSNYCFVNGLSYLKVYKGANVGSPDVFNMDFIKEASDRDIAFLLKWSKPFEKVIIINAVWKGVGSDKPENGLILQLENLRIYQNILNLVARVKPHRYVELGSYEGEILDRAKSELLLDYSPSNFDYAFTKALASNLSRLYSYLNNIDYTRFSFSAPVLAMSDDLNVGRGYFDRVVSSIKEGRKFDIPKSNNHYDFIPLHLLAEKIITLAPGSSIGEVIYIGSNIGLTPSNFFRAIEEDSFNIDAVKKKYFHGCLVERHFTGGIEFDIKKFK